MFFDTTKSPAQLKTPIGRNDRWRGSVPFSWSTGEGRWSSMQIEAETVVQQYIYGQTVKVDWPLYGWSMADAIIVILLPLLFDASDKMFEFLQQNLNQEKSSSNQDQFRNKWKQNETAR